MFDYVYRMYGQMMKLSQLGVAMDQKLIVDLDLFNLTGSYGPFIINYYKNEVSLTIPELVNLIEKIEHTFKPKGKSILLVESPGSKKGSKNMKRKATKFKGGSP